MSAGMMKTDCPRRAAVDVDIRHVDLSYGANHVLKDVNLQINPGEFFAFLGPSGCGKTTLLRLIAGFNRADRGDVLIGGADVSSLPPWKRDVGMVFQSYALWPHMSVAQNVAFGLEERKVPRDEIARRVRTALELVGLGHLGERKPSQLSGGQQQRVAIARALACEPKIMLFDEPTSSLDPELTGEVLKVMRDLAADGMTMVVVSHEIGFAASVANRITFLDEGKLLLQGTPAEVFGKPRHPRLDQFLDTYLDRGAAMLV
jgi:iron(III) transport system ATP-binding protein